MIEYDCNYQEQIRNRIVHGTTTVALRLKNGVVLAADKRATAGYYIAHKKVRKIAKIDERAAMTISGVVADAQMLVDTVKAEINYYKLTTKTPLTIRGIATVLSNIIFSYARRLPYIVQLIIAGYDVKPRLYTIDWFGTVTEERYVATGSGSPIAISIIESSYDENIPIDKGITLVIKAVNAAMKRDIASGEGVDVVTITKDKYREYSPDDLKKYLSTG